MEQVLQLVSASLKIILKGRLCSDCDSNGPCNINLKFNVCVIVNIYDLNQQQQQQKTY